MLDLNMIRHADIEYRITEVEKSASLDEEKVKKELYDALLDKKKVIEDLREQLSFRNAALEHEIAQRNLVEDDRRNLALRLEVSDLWLEPLLHTLFLYPKSVAVPLLDMIKESQYNLYGERRVTPFVVKPRHGHGVITMHPLPHDSDRNPWEPFQSAALLGGAMAAFKTTLEEFYPAGVFGSSWGVENTRLSFRMWMCATGIWVVPCSQVLHPNGEDDNLSRYFPPGRESLYDQLVNEIAAELINFMFTDREKEKVITKVTNNDEHQKMIWDLADEIRASFDPDAQGCRQYDHYRDEVLGPGYLSWEEDQFDHVGGVRSKSNPRFCMEFSIDKVISVYECRHAQPVLLDRQVIGFTKNHHIRNPMDEYVCADSSDYRDGTLVKLWSCNNLSPVTGSPSDSQYFVFEHQQIIQPPSDRCMELVTSEGNKLQILLRKCDLSNENQRWEINTSPWFL